MGLDQEVKNEVAVFNKAPLWRRIVIGLAVLGGIIYFGWCIWGSRSPKPADGFKQSPAAVKEEKIPGPTVAVKKIPKKAVKKKYPDAPIKGDEDGDGQDDEEWVDSAVVPPAPDGGTMLTKIDVKTGDVTNTFRPDPPPWYAFERKNVVGIGYEVGTQGAKVPLYYRRYIVRIKDAHVLVEAGGKLALDPREKSEAHGAVLAEGHFDLF